MATARKTGIAGAMIGMACGALVTTGLALSAMASPAGAVEIAESMSGEDIRSMLQQAGFDTTMMTDKDDGTPVAVARLGQVNFVVRALDCAGEPVRCRQLLFFANFDLEREATNEDYKTVNDFNDSSFDGRAYVLPGSSEIGVDFTIDLTGGVTPAHIESRVSRWQGIVNGFLSEMNANRTGA